MNRNNQLKKTVQDKNNFKKEEIMNTSTTIRNRSGKGLLFITMAAGLFIIAIGLVTQPFSAEARGRFGQSRSPGLIIERLTEHLDLTDEQVAEIQPIIEEKIEQMNSIREKNGTDRRAARTEMQKLKWDTEIRLNEILDEDQIEKYLELRQEMRAKRHGGKFRGNGMRKGFNMTPEQVIERLTDRLDLNEEQAAAIEPAIKESIEKKRGIFNKYGEKRREVKEAMRNELRAAGDETEAELSTILTDDQMKDLRTFKEQKRARMDKRMNRPGPMGF